MAWFEAFKKDLEKLYGAETGRIGADDKKKPLHDHLLRIDQNASRLWKLDNICTDKYTRTVTRRKAKELFRTFQNASVSERRSVAFIHNARMKLSLLRLYNNNVCLEKKRYPRTKWMFYLLCRYVALEFENLGPNSNPNNCDAEYLIFQLKGILSKYFDVDSKIRCKVFIVLIIVTAYHTYNIPKWYMETLAGLALKGTIIEKQLDALYSGDDDLLYVGDICSNDELKYYMQLDDFGTDDEDSDISDEESKDLHGKHGRKQDKFQYSNPSSVNTERDDDDDDDDDVILVKDEKDTSGCGFKRDFNESSPLRDGSSKQNRRKGNSSQDRGAIKKSGSLNSSSGKKRYSKYPSMSCRVITIDDDDDEGSNSVGVKSELADSDIEVIDCDEFISQGRASRMRNRASGRRKMRRKFLDSPEFKKSPTPICIDDDEEEQIVNDKYSMLNCFNSQRTTESPLDKSELRNSVEVLTSSINANETLQLTEASQNRNELMLDTKESNDVSKKLQSNQIQQGVSSLKIDELNQGEIFSSSNQKKCFSLNKRYDFLEELQEFSSSSASSGDILSSTSSNEAITPTLYSSLEKPNHPQTPTSPIKVAHNMSINPEVLVVEPEKISKHFSQPSEVTSTQNISKDITGENTDGFQVESTIEEPINNSDPSVSIQDAYHLSDKVEDIHTTRDQECNESSHYTVMQTINSKINDGNTIEDLPNITIDKYDTSATNQSETELLEKLQQIESSDEFEKVLEDAVVDIENIEETENSYENQNGNSPPDKETEKYDNEEIASSTNNVETFEKVIALKEIGVTAEPEKYINEEIASSTNNEETFEKEIASKVIRDIVVEIVSVITAKENSIHTPEEISNNPREEIHILNTDPNQDDTNLQTVKPCFENMPICTPKETSNHPRKEIHILNTDIKQDDMSLQTEEPCFENMPICTPKETSNHPRKEIHILNTDIKQNDMSLQTEEPCFKNISLMVKLPKELLIEQEKICLTSANITEGTMEKLENNNAFKNDLKNVQSLILEESSRIEISHNDNQSPLADILEIHSEEKTDLVDRVEPLNKKCIPPELVSDEIVISNQVNEKIDINNISEKLQPPHIVKECTSDKSKLCIQDEVPNYNENSFKNLEENTFSKTDSHNIVELELENVLLKEPAHFEDLRKSVGEIKHVNNQELITQNVDLDGNIPNILEPVVEKPLDVLIAEVDIKSIPSLDTVIEKSEMKDSMLINTIAEESAIFENNNKDMTNTFKFCETSNEILTTQALGGELQSGGLSESSMDNIIDDKSHTTIRDNKEISENTVNTPESHQSGCVEVVEEMKEKVTLEVHEKLTDKKLLVAAIEIEQNPEETSILLGNGNENLMAGGENHTKKTETEATDIDGPSTLVVNENKLSGFGNLKANKELTLEIYPKKMESDQVQIEIDRSSIPDTKCDGISDEIIFAAQILENLNTLDEHSEIPSKEAYRASTICEDAKNLSDASEDFKTFQNKNILSITELEIDKSVIESCNDGIVETKKNIVQTKSDMKKTKDETELVIDSKTLLSNQDRLDVVPLILQKARVEEMGLLPSQSDHVEETENLRQSVEKLKAYIIPTSEKETVTPPDEEINVTKIIPKPKLENIFKDGDTLPASNFKEDISIYAKSDMAVTSTVELTVPNISLEIVDNKETIPEVGHVALEQIGDESAVHMENKVDLVSYPVLSSEQIVAEQESVLSQEMVFTCDTKNCDMKISQVVDSPLLSQQKGPAREHPECNLWLLSATADICEKIIPEEDDVKKQISKPVVKLGRKKRKKNVTETNVDYKRMTRSCSKSQNRNSRVGKKDVTVEQNENLKPKQNLKKRTASAEKTGSKIVKNSDVDVVSKSLNIVRDNIKQPKKNKTEKTEKGKGPKGKKLSHKLKEKNGLSKRKGKLELIKENSLLEKPVNKNLKFIDSLNSNDDSNDSFEGKLIIPDEPIPIDYTVTPKKKDPEISKEEVIPIKKMCDMEIQPEPVPSLAEAFNQSIVLQDVSKLVDESRKQTNYNMDYILGNLQPKESNEDKVHIPTKAQQKFYEHAKKDRDLHTPQYNPSEAALKLDIDSLPYSVNNLLKVKSSEGTPKCIPYIDDAKNNLEETSKMALEATSYPAENKALTIKIDIKKESLMTFGSNLKSPKKRWEMLNKTEIDNLQCETAKASNECPVTPEKRSKVILLENVLITPKRNAPKEVHSSEIKDEILSVSKLDVDTPNDEVIPNQTSNIVPVIESHESEHFKIVKDDPKIVVNIEDRGIDPEIDKNENEFVDLARVVNSADVPRNNIELEQSKSSDIKNSGIDFEHFKTQDVHLVSEKSDISCQKNVELQTMEAPGKNEYQATEETAKDITITATEVSGNIEYQSTEEMCKGISNIATEVYSEALLDNENNISNSLISENEKLLKGDHLSPKEELISHNEKLLKSEDLSPKEHIKVGIDISKNTKMITLNEDISLKLENKINDSLDKNITKLQTESTDISSEKHVFKGSKNITEKIQKSKSMKTTGQKNKSSNKNMASHSVKKCDESYNKSDVYNAEKKSSTKIKLRSSTSKHFKTDCSNQQIITNNDESNTPITSDDDSIEKIMSERKNHSTDRKNRENVEIRSSGRSPRSKQKCKQDSFQALVVEVEDIGKILPKVPINEQAKKLLNKSVTDLKDCDKKTKKSSTEIEGIEKKSSSPSIPSQKSDSKTKVDIPKKQKEFGTSSRSSRNRDIKTEDKHNDSISKKDKNSEEESMGKNKNAEKKKSRKLSIQKDVNKSLLILEKNNQSEEIEFSTDKSLKSNNDNGSKRSAKLKSLKPKDSVKCEDRKCNSPSSKEIGALDAEKSNSSKNDKNKSHIKDKDKKKSSRSNKHEPGKETLSLDDQQNEKNIKPQNKSKPDSFEPLKLDNIIIDLKSKMEKKQQSLAKNKDIKEETSVLNKTEMELPKLDEKNKEITGDILRTQKNDEKNKCVLNSIVHNETAIVEQDYGHYGEKKYGDISEDVDLKKVDIVGDDMNDDEELKSCKNLEQIQSPKTHKAISEENFVATETPKSKRKREEYEGPQNKEQPTDNSENNENEESNEIMLDFQKKMHLKPDGVCQSIKMKTSIDTEDRQLKKKIKHVNSIESKFEKEKVNSQNLEKVNTTIQIIQCEDELGRNELEDESVSRKEDDTDETGLIKSNHLVQDQRMDIDKNVSSLSMDNPITINPDNAIIGNNRNENLSDIKQIQCTTEIEPEKLTCDSGKSSCNMENAAYISEMENKSVLPEICLTKKLNEEEKNNLNLEEHKSIAQHEQLEDIFKIGHSQTMEKIKYTSENTVSKVTEYAQTCYVESCSTNVEETDFIIEETPPSTITKESNIVENVLEHSAINSTIIHEIKQDTVEVISDEIIDHPTNNLETNIAEEGNKIVQDNIPLQNSPSGIIESQQICPKTNSAKSVDDNYTSIENSEKDASIPIPTIMQETENISTNSVTDCTIISNNASRAHPIIDIQENIVDNVIPLDSTNHIEVLSDINNSSVAVLSTAINVLNEDIPNIDTVIEKLEEINTGGKVEQSTYKHDDHQEKKPFDNLALENVTTKSKKMESTEIIVENKIQMTKKELNMDTIRCKESIHNKREDKCKGVETKSNINKGREKIECKKMIHSERDNSKLNNKINYPINVEKHKIENNEKDEKAFKMRNENICEESLDLQQPNVIVEHIPQFYDEVYQHQLNAVNSEKVIAPVVNMTSGKIIQPVPAQDINDIPTPVSLLDVFPQNPTDLSVVNTTIQPPVPSSSANNCRGSGVSNLNSTKSTSPSLEIDDTPLSETVRKLGHFVTEEVSGTQSGVSDPYLSVQVCLNDLPPIKNASLDNSPVDSSTDYQFSDNHLGLFMENNDECLIDPNTSENMFTPNTCKEEIIDHEEEVAYYLSCEQPRPQLSNVSLNDHDSQIMSLETMNIYLDNSLPAETSPCQKKVKTVSVKDELTIQELIMKSTSKENCFPLSNFGLGEKEHEDQELVSWSQKSLMETKKVLTSDAINQIFLHKADSTNTEQHEPFHENDLPIPRIIPPPQDIVVSSEFRPNEMPIPQTLATIPLPRESVMGPVLNQTETTPLELTNLQTLEPSTKTSKKKQSKPPQTFVGKINLVNIQILKLENKDERNFYVHTSSLPKVSLETKKQHASIKETQNMIVDKTTDHSNSKLPYLDVPKLKKKLDTAVKSSKQDGRKRLLSQTETEVQKNENAKKCKIDKEKEDVFDTLRNMDVRTLPLPTLSTCTILGNSRDKSFKNSGNVRNPHELVTDMSTKKVKPNPMAWEEMSHNFQQETIKKPVDKRHSTLIEQEQHHSQSPSSSRKLTPDSSRNSKSAPYSTNLEYKPSSDPSNSKGHIPNSTSSRWGPHRDNRYRRYEQDHGNNSRSLYNNSRYPSHTDPRVQNDNRYKHYRDNPNKRGHSFGYYHNFNRQHDRNRRDYPEAHHYSQKEVTFPMSNFRVGNPRAQYQQQSWEDTKYLESIDEMLSRPKVTFSVKKTDNGRN